MLRDGCRGEGLLQINSNEWPWIVGLLDYSLKCHSSIVEQLSVHTSTSLSPSSCHTINSAEFFRIILPSSVLISQSLLNTPTRNKMKSTVVCFLAILSLTSAQLIAEWGRESPKKRARNPRSLQVSSMSMDFMMPGMGDMSMSAPSFIPPVGETSETASAPIGEVPGEGPIVTSVVSSAASVAISGAVAVCAAGAMAFL